MQDQNFANFESNIGRNLYNSSMEKTNVDKLLARDELVEIKELIQKGDMTREEMIRLVHLLTSVQTKVLNFDKQGNDRWVCGKYYIWLREFSVLAALLFDFRAKIGTKEGYDLSEAEKSLVMDSHRSLMESLKFMISIYQFIGNSTLSMEGVAFEKLSSTNYRYAYPNQAGLDEVNKPGIIGRIMGRNQ